MPPPSKSPKHSHSSASRSQSSTGASTNALKKKIRDVERLLAKNTKLPATARLENERLLSAFKHELALATQAQKEQKNFKKYHMVRFFERQKATRHLKKINRELAACENDPPEDLKRRAHAAEVELNYTLYYPMSEKYISLWPKVPGSDRKVDQKREAIKADVEKRMRQGTLGTRTTRRDEEDDSAQETSEDEAPPKKMKKLEAKDKGTGGSKGKGKKHKEKEEEATSRNQIQDDEFFDL